MLLVSALGDCLHPFPLVVFPSRGVSACSAPMLLRCVLVHGGLCSLLPDFDSDTEKAAELNAMVWKDLWL